MDKRTIIILIGLLLPLMALILLAHSEPEPVPEPAGTAKSLPPIQSLEDARQRARIISDTLDHMTDEQWNEQQKRRATKKPDASPRLDQPRELPNAQGNDEKD